MSLLDYLTAEQQHDDRYDDMPSMNDDIKAQNEALKRANREMYRLIEQSYRYVRATGGESPEYYDLKSELRTFMHTARRKTG